MNQQRPIVIKAVGDVMLVENVLKHMKRNGIDYLFERVRPLLGDADVTVANLECALTERGKPVYRKPLRHRWLGLPYLMFAFRAPPPMGASLVSGGISLVSLGNNHVMDYGPEGLEDTLAALDSFGIAHSGAGRDEAEARRPVVVEAAGKRLAFLSYSNVHGIRPAPATPMRPGVAWATAEAVEADVRTAKKESDFVIVSLHSGTEYADSPAADQQSAAGAAVAAGAVLVLGHHPHVLQGWERVGEALIVYSLGNFVADPSRIGRSKLGLRPLQSVVLRVELGEKGIGKVQAEPVFIDLVEHRPRPADSQEAELIRTHLAGLNAALGSP